MSSIMPIPRMWVTMKVVEQTTGIKTKALYQQIRKGTFPFRYRRAGRSILVSALDLGLIDSECRSEKLQQEIFKL